MFGQPVHRLLAEMPAAEFRAWATYRARRGFAHREIHMLAARLAHGYFSVHKKKDASAPELSEFYAPLKDHGKADSRYTPEERKTLQSLMKDR